MFAEAISTELKQRATMAPGKKQLSSPPPSDKNAEGEGSQGKFPQPAGRPKKNSFWDGNTGEWVLSVPEVIISSTRLLPEGWKVEMGAASAAKKNSKNNNKSNSKGSGSSGNPEFPPGWSVIPKSGGHYTIFSPSGEKYTSKSRALEALRRPRNESSSVPPASSSEEEELLMKITSPEGTVFNKVKGLNLHDNSRNFGFYLGLSRCVAERIWTTMSEDARRPYEETWRVRREKREKQVKEYHLKRWNLQEYVGEPAKRASRSNTRRGNHTSFSNCAF